MPGTMDLIAAPRQALAAAGRGSGGHGILHAAWIGHALRGVEHFQSDEVAVRVVVENTPGSSSLSSMGASRKVIHSIKSRAISGCQVTFMAGSSTC